MCFNHLDIRLHMHSACRCSTRCCASIRGQLRRSCVCMRLIIKAICQGIETPSGYSDLHICSPGILFKLKGMRWLWHVWCAIWGMAWSSDASHHALMFLCWLPRQHPHLVTPPPPPDAAMESCARLLTWSPHMESSHVVLFGVLHQMLPFVHALPYDS